MKLKFFIKKELPSRSNGWQKVISQGSKEEEKLLFKTEKELVEAYDNGRAIIALNDEEQIVGFMALWPLGQDKKENVWYEIGTTYVLKPYRNMGICKAMISYSASAWKGNRIIATSRNKKAIRASLHTMVPVEAVEDLEHVIPLTCCCGPEDGGLDNINCVYRNKECVFMITPETADCVNYCIRNDIQETIKD